mgnify:CR=1 FL=1
MARVDGCPMKEFRVESSMAWAEDTALLGSNRSADPGAKTERRAMDSSTARLFPTPFGIGIKAINPSRRSRELLEIQKPGDGLTEVANSEGLELHFRLNHYTYTAAMLGLAVSLRTR